MAKKKVKKGVVKELFDIEIDEVSAVDSPAIGESFYITKSVNKKTTKKGNAMGKPVTKSSAWKGTVKKSEGECTHCVFCGITKDEEAEQLGAGLIKNVCFECALEHHEKGVFDACIEGTFSAQKFKEDNPDMEMFLEVPTAKSEDDAGEDDEEDESGEEDSGASDDEGSSDEDGGSSDDEDDSSDEDDDEEEGEEGSDDTAKSDKNKGSKPGQESDVVEKLTKRVEEVEAMLERTLELHDVAAGALNEVVALTFASLDAIMAIAEERVEESNDEKTQSLFSEINDSIKSVREDVTKAGAKISGKRMAVLREISEKLTELITSVLGQEATKGLSKAADDKLQKSLEELKKSFQDELSTVKEDYETRLKEVTEKLEDVEQAGGGSFDLGDDDTTSTQTVVEDEDTEKSVFAGVIDVKDIQKKIDRKKRNLTR